jgi:hypothetical protein
MMTCIVVIGVVIIKLIETIARKNDSRLVNSGGPREIRSDYYVKRHPKWKLEMILYSIIIVTLFVIFAVLVLDTGPASLLTTTCHEVVSTTTNEHGLTATDVTTVLITTTVINIIVSLTVVCLKKLYDFLSNRSFRRWQKKRNDAKIAASTRK